MQATSIAQVLQRIFSSRAETSLSRLVRFFVSVSVLMPLGSEAATYYTNNTGNDSYSCALAQNVGTPKLTINAGKNCLTKPGDTLIVGDGTYVENEIDMTVSGAAGSPITIKAEHALLAILSSTSGNSCGPNIAFYASYIVIDGLRGEINVADPACGTNSAAGAFVRMWSSSNPSISGSSTTGYVGGVVRNCQVDASSHRGVGIKTNQDNSLVENCLMHSSLEAFNGINQIFRNNYIDTNDAWGDEFTIKGGARNGQFYNNVLHKTGGWRALVLGGNSGVATGIWDTSTAYECFNCVAYNNVVVVDSGSGSYALVLAGCYACAVYNNIVINGSLNFMKGGDSGGSGPQPFPANSIVENNIFYCGGAAAHTGTTYTGFFTEDYNNFYTCTGTPSQVHAITGDPQFLNLQSDWHLSSGSPALGSGVQVSFTSYGGELIDVSKDKTGVVRTAPWTLGIYAGNSSSSDLTPPSAPKGLTVR